MAVTHLQLTADEFEAALDAIGERHELIEGEVVTVVPDGVAASREALRIASALHLWVAGPDGFGEVLLDRFVRLDGHNQLGPDLAWYAEAPTETSGAVRSRVPDLAIEVLASRTRENDLGPKLAVYRRNGVKDYWVVDPDAGELLACPFADGASALEPVGQLSSPRLPGFAIGPRPA